MLASHERSEEIQHLLPRKIFLVQQLHAITEFRPAHQFRARFAPLAGDSRLLASTNASGEQRPLLWNPRTGERTDLSLTDLEGEVAPLDWSPDGTRLLLCEVARARQQLLVYEVASGALRRLGHRSGTYGFLGQYGVYFGSNDAIHKRAARCEKPDAYGVSW